MAKHRIVNFQGELAKGACESQRCLQFWLHTSLDIELMIASTLVLRFATCLLLPWMLLMSQQVPLLASSRLIQFN